MRSSILMLGLVIGEAAAGCGFHSSAGVAGGGDGGSTDGNGGCKSFATLVSTCPLSFEADLTVNRSARYDTDAHVLVVDDTATPFAIKTVMIGADPVDVISAHDVHLGLSAYFRATGSHGLAIIASNDFVIDADAQIDVGKGGAGARPSCPGGATSGTTNPSGGGGGGGGGFGDVGGKGGGGNQDGTPGPGGSQGSAEASFPLFHGGCPGADGGGGDLPGGAGGQAGGALYIVAAGHMVFTGTEPLYAGGDGGKGGGHSTNAGDAGGGGGGSGGLLIVEAPQITGAGAIITANGGAGGEGSDRNGPGADGSAGTLTRTRAPGGFGESTTGGDGGDGGSAEGTAGQSVMANADGGGGGGGGGAGFIRIYSDHPVGLAVSPASS